MRGVQRIAAAVAVLCFSSDAWASGEKLDLFGRSVKLQDCGELESASVTQIPEPGSQYLRLVCARGSQFVVANADWEIRGAGNEQTVFAPFWGEAMLKGRVFSAMTARELSAEEAKTEFLSGYQTDRMVLLIGETEYKPDPFMTMVKDNAERQLAIRPLGEVATIIDITGADGVRHTLYLFINGEDEFTAAVYTALGEAKQLSPLVVSKRIPTGN